MHPSSHWMGVCGTNGFYLRERQTDTHQWNGQPRRVALLDQVSHFRQAKLFFITDDCRSLHTYLPNIQLLFVKTKRKEKDEREREGTKKEAKGQKLNPQWLLMPRTRNVAAKKAAYCTCMETNRIWKLITFPARLVHVAMQPFFLPVKTVRGACCFCSPGQCRHHRQEEKEK